MSKNKKPIIGIIARPDVVGEYNVLLVVESYRKAIILSGGNPILILPTQLEEYNNTMPKSMQSMTEIEKEMITNQINLCDGILMPGGTKRFEYDRYITNYCLDNNIPILGICLGMQLLATHINRDTLETIHSGNIHSRSEINNAHTVKIDKSSKLYNILQKEEICVNSRHRYKVTEIDSFTAVGYSNDGIIEAIERKDKNFAIGVQWHPENLMDTEHSKKLFNSFIESCNK